MTIHTFLKAEKGDPDWQFTPEEYFGKEFKVIDANMIELDEDENDRVVLRQNPTEKDLLAKHLSITLQKNSVLDLVILNDVDSRIQQVFLYDVHLKTGSTLSLGMFIKNGKLNKHIVQIFQEETSTFSGYGLISNNVKGDSEVITKVIHNGADTLSNQFFLGIAGKESQTVFQGAVVTEPVAEISQIGIENSNLIVGEGGRCFSKPEIYIDSNYSSSGLGSETTTISAEKIGYLQSKGISEESAKNLIVSSFRNQSINLVNQSSIREEIKEMYTD